MNEPDPKAWLSPVAYDKAAFIREFAREFSESQRWNAAVVPNAQLLMAMIEMRPSITDLRWAAYMLATVLWETASPNRVERPARSRQGKVLKDKHGRTVMLKHVHWTYTMAPVVEVGRGAGKRYHEPVKVKLLDSGAARVTEHDGDQFLVTSTGTIKPLTKGARLGARAGATPAATYDQDDGDENAYFGRGYVQLTWWSNYAKAGIAIGRGLDLLQNPDSLKTPQVAFDVMAHGMLPGQGFANGHSLAQYIEGARCDYAGARAIVNGLDHAREIAELAKKMERVLLNSKPAASAGDCGQSANSARRP